MQDPESDRHDQIGPEVTGCSAVEGNQERP
jgi:hypothetical protein